MINQKFERKGWNNGHQATLDYISSSLHYWQPGKIHVTKYELVNDWFIGAFDKRNVTEGLARLEFQLDRMTRNSTTK